MHRVDATPTTTKAVDDSPSDNTKRAEAPAVHDAGTSVNGMAAVPTSDATVLYRFPDNPPEGRFPYSMCLGVPQPPFIQEWALRDLRASAGWQRDSDIWVATYPKNGTTWMLQIIKLLLSGGEMPEGTRIDLSPRSPDVPCASSQSNARPTNYPPRPDLS